MILASIEGNLSGFQSIQINKPVPLAEYIVKFYFKYTEAEEYVEFKPSFPYFKQPGRVFFQMNNDYISLLIKVDVILYEVEPGDCRPVGYCDECIEMNKDWKKLT